VNFPVTVHDLRANFDAPSFAILVVAVVALGVWLLLFAWRWWASHPRMPDAGPETTELGPEPPAISNFLVNRWAVTRSALGATFLDLCARRAFSLQQLDEEHFVVHMGDLSRTPDLLPYEKQVLDLVRSRATGGSCPVEALQLNEYDAESWWKRFSDAIVKEARDSGLARNRWSRFDWVLVSGGFLVVAELFALSFGQAGIGAHRAASGSDSNITRSDWLLYAGGAWFLASVAFSRLKSVRDTAAGQSACAGWLGVRDYFRHSHAFDHAPAAAVVLWDRNLAYGAALGVAHEAVHALPFEAESPDSAWSRYGGDWHEVRVRYPTRFGACQKPVKVLFEGLARALFWGALAFVALPLVLRPILDVLDTLQSDGTITDRTQLEIGGAIIVVLSATGIYLTARFLGGAIRVWRAIGDLRHENTVEGEVVKVHLGRVAVFDGKDEDVVAWLPPKPGQHFSRGMKVRMRITPHLHWVNHVEALDGAAVPEPAAARAMGAGQSPFEGLGLALPPLLAPVQAATGLALVAANPGGALPGMAQAFRDPAGNSVMVAAMRIPEGPAGAIASMMMRRVAKGSQVEGLGEAAWYHGGTLVVRRGDQMLMIKADLKGRPDEAELEAAKTVAVAALGQVPTPPAAPAQPPPAASDAARPLIPGA
jgi:hypothetical protein